MIVTWLARRQVRRVFAGLSAGDTSAALGRAAPDVHHRFAGDHALGGERHSRAALEEWFGRLFRLFPSIDFTVHDVRVDGPPWDLRVVAEWTAEVTPAVGPAYKNVGAHVLRIRRGTVVCIHAYEDSQAVAQACVAMAEAGVAEAAAPSISG